MNTKAPVPIPVMGIPHYNRPELLARCLASIDHPVEKLVLIQNGPEEEMILMPGSEPGDNKIFQMPAAEGMRQLKPIATWRRELVREIIWITHPNAGVAGAWNEIIKLFPAAWWMITNNDIQFAPGDLGKLAEKASGQCSVVSGQTPLGMVYGNHGASWFAITAEAVARVGLFDENIFPAYLEDCDWAYRADQLGVRRGDVPDVHARHGDGRLTGSCTVNATRELQEQNARTHGGNFDYYRRKWGGLNGTEQFTTPFDDPHWPLWAWRFEPDTRARQQWRRE